MLTPCEACDQSISPKAVACPQCGHPASSGSPQADALFCLWPVFASVAAVVLATGAVALPSMFCWTWWGSLGSALAAIGLFAALASLFGTLTARTSLGWDVFRGVVLGVWILAPPAWIMFEYAYFYPDGAFDERTRSHVVHTHDLLRNVWAAVSAMLGGAYLRK